MPSDNKPSGPYGSHSARAPFDPRFEETSPIASVVSEGEKVGNIKDQDVQESTSRRPIHPRTGKALYHQIVGRSTRGLNIPKDTTWDLNEEFFKAADIFGEDDDRNRLFQEYYAHVERVKDELDLDNMIVDRIMDYLDQGYTEPVRLWRDLQSALGIDVPLNTLTTAIRELADIAERYSDVRTSTSRSSP